MDRRRHYIGIHLPDTVPSWYKSLLYTGYGFILGMVGRDFYLKHLRSGWLMLVVHIC